MGAVRIRHSIREFATQPVILWIPLGGKPKWLLLNFGFNDVMRTAPISFLMMASFSTPIPPNPNPFIYLFPLCYLSLLSILSISVCLFTSFILPILLLSLYTLERFEDRFCKWGFQVNWGREEWAMLPQQRLLQASKTWGWVTVVMLLIFSEIAKKICENANEHQTFCRLLHRWWKYSHFVLNKGQWQRPYRLIDVATGVWENNLKTFQADWTRHAVKKLAHLQKSHFNLVKGRYWYVKKCKN